MSFKVCDVILLPTDEKAEVGMIYLKPIAGLQALMTIPDVSPDGLAKTAVYWADELIKQLDK